MRIGENSGESERFRGTSRESRRIKKIRADPKEHETILENTKKNPRESLKIRENLKRSKKSDKF